MTTPRSIPRATTAFGGELVSIVEACKRLQVGESTLYRALKDGSVPGGRQLGGRWIIARAVFERWLVDGIEPETPIVLDEPDRPTFVRRIAFPQREVAS